MSRREKRRVPQRTCIVCGGKKAKLALLRLALDDESRVCLDRRQRYAGRGGYVCSRPECLARLKLDQLQKAFRRSLSADGWDPALTMAEALQSFGEHLKKQQLQ
ncbi:MAG: DUF448 domain-containing protein [Deltaproteobacteria bacterium]|nr:MAG: DUF448 domain-containing protein [Deltaproteobacteria bacterium]